MRRFLFSLWCFWYRFSIGWCLGKFGLWTAAKLLPSSAPSSAEFTLATIVAIAAWTLGMRAWDWSIDRGAEWYVGHQIIRRLKESRPHAGQSVSMVRGEWKENKEQGK